jgi:hypothetical protein
MEITEAVAKKVLAVVDAGLCSGVGSPVPGKMCVEAAVCYALGQPHGDEPTCVAPALREFKIRLNDSAWASNMTRAKGMRRLAIAQLGSAGALDEKEFARRCVDLAVGKIVPFALRKAARLHLNEEHKRALEAAAKRCETDRDKTAANAANAAAKAAAKAAAYAAADAADAAADAADAAANAAYAADASYAAYAAAYAADAADAAAAARDKFLSFIAEEVVKILIEMNAPGCAFLSLAPVDEA